MQEEIAARFRASSGPSPGGRGTGHDDRPGLPWAPGVVTMDDVIRRQPGVQETDAIPVPITGSEPASTSEPIDGNGAIPPLRDGDRLSRDEFERRYDAMPHLKKAELIEGVVSVPSPVGWENHGEPHST